MSSPRRRKKAVKKSTRNKKTRIRLKKKTRTSAGKKTRKKTAKSATNRQSSTALKRLQPELEKSLTQILRRSQRKLGALPRTPQLKLLELEVQGYTYVLNRIRPLLADNMTDRQKQISRLVSQGLSNKQIGSKLRISPATVAAHLRTIFTKLRLKTRTALARHALAYYA